MNKLLIQFVVCAAALTTGSAYAETTGELETHASVELAKGVCADPAMSDEDRAEMVSRSLDDAIACMGSDWVYGDMPEIQTSALGGLDIDANISANRIRITDRDGSLRVILTSPGLPGPDTETLTGEFIGPFRVEGPDYTVQGRDYDYFGAPMPWAVFYKGGYAIHGTDKVSRLGRPASHGCLRVLTKQAALINASVRQANNASVQIHVYGRAASGITRQKVRRSRPPADDFGVDEPVPRRRSPSYDDDGFPRGY